MLFGIAWALLGGMGFVGGVAPVIAATKPPPELSDEDREKLGRSFLSKLTGKYKKKKDPQPVLTATPVAQPLVEVARPLAEVENPYLRVDTSGFVEKNLPEIIPSSELARAGLPDSLSDDSLFLLAKIKDIDLPDVTVLYRGGILYVGLESFFYSVDFPISVEPFEKTAKGWFRRESNKFLMTVEENVKVMVRNEKYNFPRSNIIIEDEDIYVPAAYIKSWFLIDLNVNYRDQVLEMASNFPLPIQERIARNQMKSRMQVGGLPAPKLPLRNSEYKMFAVPFLDVQLNSNLNKNRNGTKVSGNYSVIGGGDLLNMSANYFASGKEDQLLSNLRLSLFREDPEGRMFGPLGATYLGIGDMGSIKVPLIRSGGNGRGIRIGNRPIGTSQNRETTDIRGDVQPGWDVELYRNGQLLERIVAKEDGLYEFLDIPLYFGENDFKIIMYGPQGQIREQSQSVPLNRASVAGNELRFDLAAVQLGSDFLPAVSNTNNDPKYLQFSGQVEKTIGGFASLNAGFSNNQYKDGSHHNFIYGGTDIFLKNALIGINLVKDLNGGHALEVDGTTRLGNHALKLGYSRFENGFKKNSDDLAKIVDTITGRATGALLKFKNNSLLYTASGSYTRLKDGGRQYSLGFDLGTSIMRWRVSNSISLSRLELTTGNTIGNTNGSFQITKNFDRFRMRAFGNYSIEPKFQLQNISNTFYWSDSKFNKYQLTASYQPSIKEWSASAGVVWDTDFASFIPNVTYRSNGDVAAIISVRFGMGQDPYNGDFKTYNKSISQAGAVAARVFEDLDMDGVYDEGEPLIEGAKIKGIQARKTAFSGPTGVAFLTGLRRNVHTDVELDIASLSDPFWIPSRKGISIKPRAGNMEILDIPLVKSTEIEGVIQLQHKSGALTQGNNIPMVLKDVRGNVIATTVSAYDGFYMFSGVGPGHYILSLDPDYITARNIQPVEPFELRVTGTGEILMGQDFKVMKQGAGFIRLDQIEDGVATNVLYLGDYETSLNLKVMWLKIRRKIPEEMKHLLPVIPFKSNMLKNADGTYPLMIGPVQGNGSTEEAGICQALDVLKIACAVKTVDLPSSL